MIKIVSTDKAPAAVGPYSQALEVNGFVFCSGQIGLDPKTGNLVEGFENQVRQVLSNLKAVLEEAGSDFEHVVKLKFFIKIWVIILSLIKFMVSILMIINLPEQLWKYLDYQRIALSKLTQ